MTLRWLVLAVLLLAGCAEPDVWRKAATDAATTAKETQDCRDIAAIAIQTDIDIDNDIAATHRDEQQRTGIARVNAQAMRERTRDRAAAIVDACMRTKGFARGR